MTTDVLANGAPILSLPPLFDAVAITIGAVSGALHAGRKDFDLMGVLAIAFLTGLGGGLIRDVILEQGTPAFLTNAQYLGYALLGSVIGVVFAKLVQRWQSAIGVVDIATLGVWVLLGCQKAVAAGLPAIGVVFVGVVASVGGGLLRDLSCGEVPSALRPGEWLAAASFLAACAYVSLWSLGTPVLLAEALTLAVAGGFRWAMMDSRFHPPQPMDLTTRLRPARAARSAQPSPTP